MFLSCNNISKSFGEIQVLSKCSFILEEKEKAAIVGINGAGKSTLLKIISGKMKSDLGEVYISTGKTIGYLAQHQEINDETTIYNEVLKSKKDIIQLEEKIRSIENKMKKAKGDELNELLEMYNQATHSFEVNDGFSYKSEIVGVLKGLGFKESEFEKEIKTLSGGEKTRVSLGKMLLKKPDLLLLDEPTNHLDMEAISWLENYITNYKGSVLIVTHDRYFLDKVATKIIEVERGVTNIFKGNYSYYASEKEKITQVKLKEYYNSQKEIKHQEEVIEKLKSFNREKSIKRAESREKMLGKIKVVEKPIVDNSKMKITIEPEVLSGNDVLKIDNLEKGFKDEVLFKEVSFEIKRGDKAAIIGKNGAGKTTILKIINGIIDDYSGEIKIGTKVKIGYYDQEHNLLNKDKSIFDEIRDEFPDLDNTRIRNILAAFLFTGDDVFKKIKELSGGERGRVSLAKLMLSKANFLIMDEPTNHLDIISKQILESALNSYTGTILYVSHDRYFINKTATRILELVNKNINLYEGDYDYYIEKREINNTLDALDTQGQIEKKESKLSWEQEKEEQAKERKKANQLKKTEEEIFMLEERTSAIDEEMCENSISTDVEKLVKLNNEKNEITSRLEFLYEIWESLAN